MEQIISCIKQAQKLANDTGASVYVLYVNRRLIYKTINLASLSAKTIIIETIRPIKGKGYVETDF